MASYFTICARNYLAYALTLGDSLKQADPDAAFYIFLADAPLEEGSDRHTIIDLDRLMIDGLELMTFIYDVMEFSTAIKPWCFEYLFDQTGAESAIYLDPDILVLRPVTGVLNALSQGMEAVLTPHLTAPLPEDGKSPSNLQILASGTYNFGFLALANRPAARRFLDWWKSECRWNCIVDYPNGLFVDQKFGEFVPSFIPATKILDDVSCNVAYWNLPQRRVEKEGAGWSIDGIPLTFFHFSGFVADDPFVLSKHQNRLNLPDIPALAELFSLYGRLLEENGHAAHRHIKYAYGDFADGEPIPKAVRRYFRQERLDGNDIPSGLHYEDELTALSPPDNDIGLTRYMREVWNLRPGLQSLFDLTSPSGQKKFVEWFHNFAEKEGLVTQRYLTPPGHFSTRAKIALRSIARRARDVGRR